LLLERRWRQLLFDFARVLSPLSPSLTKRWSVDALRREVGRYFPFFYYSCGKSGVGLTGLIRAAGLLEWSAGTVIPPEQWVTGFTASPVKTNRPSQWANLQSV